MLKGAFSVYCTILNMVKHQTLLTLTCLQGLQVQAKNLPCYSLKRLNVEPFL